MTALSSIAIAALAVSAGATVFSTVQQSKAAGEAEEERDKQFAAQQNIQKLRERNARLRQIREERIKRAQNVQRGASAGGVAGLEGSSGFQGTQGSLRTQLATNISQQAQVSGLQTIVGQTSKNIFDISSDLQTKQGIAKSVSAVSGTIFQAAGGFDAFKGGGGTAEPTLERPKSFEYDFNFGL